METPLVQLTPFERLRQRFPERVGQALDVVQALVENRELPPIPPPLQVELHPGTSCAVHCPHCTGLHLRRRPRSELPLEPLVRLVGALRRSGVDRVTVSGIYTDPLSYSELCHLLCCIRENGLSIGLHTKFVNATPDLLAELSRAYADSYVNISIDYWRSESYQQYLHPETPDALETAMANTERLCAGLETSAARVSVAIVSLLHQSITLADLETGAAFYHGLRARYPHVSINWRMSVPWVPTSRLRLLSADSSRAVQPTVAGAAALVRRVRDLQSAAGAIPGTGQITFRHNELLAMPCSACLSQLLYGAIGSCGGFYPCQGIASPEYGHLSYGNLHDGDDFLERWFGRGRAELGFRPGGAVCPACAAPTEREVNVFAKLATRHLPAVLSSAEL